MKTTAQEIMTHEVLSIREGASLEDALKILINNRITGLPVVNAKNEMVGIVSEYDIMAQIAEMPNLESASLTAPFKFAKRPRSISPETSLKEIVNLFLDLKYRRLPVVHKKKLVGIITRRDVMRLFYYRARLK